MANPKVGMHYGDVEKRVRRISKNDKIDVRIKSNLIGSLVNQATLHEGRGAGKELRYMLEKDRRR